MAHDPGYVRFFTYLALFSSSMLGLIVSPNLLEIYVFWELVGMCSYLLVGFWYDRDGAAHAAQKAFIVNRVGDFGLLLGILGLFWATGSFDFHGIADGLSVAVGMSIAYKLDEKPYNVYTLLGDGELSEGSVWEALTSANKYKLDNLIIIIDRNRLQITGNTEEVNPIEPLIDKFKAFGLIVKEVDLPYQRFLNITVSPGNVSGVIICLKIVSNVDASIGENGAVSPV